MNSKVSTGNFSKLIESDELDDLNLTIYYLSPYTLTVRALSGEDLENGSYEHRIVVDGDRLKEHIDLLKQLGDTELIPVEQESAMDARIYYIFKNEKSNEIFSVVSGGKNDSMFVNGDEVQGDKIFYEVILPFLPESAAEEVQAIINRRYKNQGD